VHRQRQKDWMTDAVKMTVTLTGVRITRYVLNVVDSESEVTMEEDLDLSFDAIEIRYTGHKQQSGKWANQPPQANFNMKSDGGTL
jgi:type VI protein secretion system component Hcp